jgi:hypothetical protein
MQEHCVSSTPYINIGRPDKDDYSISPTTPHNLALNQSWNSAFIFLQTPSGKVVNVKNPIVASDREDHQSAKSASAAGVKRCSLNESKIVNQTCRETEH